MGGKRPSNPPPAPRAQAHPPAPPVRHREPEYGPAQPVEPQKLVASICPNCGGPLELVDGKCSYCGSVFLSDVTNEAKNLMSKTFQKLTDSGMLYEDRKSGTGNVGPR